MKFVFIGVPGESHESLTMYGVTFEAGVPAEVEDERYIAKLANHPHFSAVGEPVVSEETQTQESPPEPPKRRGRPPKA